MLRLWGDAKEVNTTIKDNKISKINQSLKICLEDKDVTANRGKIPK